jgi:hypothetical protein
VLSDVRTDWLLWIAKERLNPLNKNKNTLQGLESTPLTTILKIVTGFASEKPLELLPFLLNTQLYHLGRSDGGGPSVCSANNISLI